MIEAQVKAVRDEMLRIMWSFTENVTTRYFAEMIADQFASINKGNPAYSKEVPVEYAAWVELPKYLDVCLADGYRYVRRISTERREALGGDYDDLIEAYAELAKIRTTLWKM